MVVISTGSIILNIVQRQTINKLRESSETLIKNAYYNPVTSLPNEANFDILLKEQIDRALRHKKTFLFMYIKLKYYENDDDIINAATKLSECIRSEDSLAHIHNDEFVILFNEYLEKENYNIVLERIVSAFPKYSIRVGTSTFPHDGEDKKYLLKSAKENATK
jgi:GGDEF domain-containing protein